MNSAEVRPVNTGRTAESIGEARRQCNEKDARALATRQKIPIRAMPVLPDDLALLRYARSVFLSLRPLRAQVQVEGSQIRQPEKQKRRRCQAPGLCAH